MGRTLKRAALLTLLLLFLPQGVLAAALPEEALDIADGKTADIVEKMERFDASEFFSGVAELLRSLRPDLAETLREAARTAVLLLLIVLLLSLAGSLFQGADGERFDVTALVGALLMSTVVLRDISGLMQSSLQLLTELESFMNALFPVLSAAVAATGAVNAASIHQVATVWLATVFVRGLSSFLIPLLTAYIALVTASAALPGDTLGALAEGLKKGVTWLLGAVVSLFTAYLSAAHVLSGSADAMALRLTRAALTGVVPVVGNVLSGTAETVLAGAGLVKNAVGIVGLLGVLSMTLLPFLRLLIQYLACRAAALAAAAAEGGKLSLFLMRLGGAFGLLLGMVGVAALLLLIAIFASVAVVMP